MHSTADSSFELRTALIIVSTMLIFLLGLGLNWQ